METFYIKQTRSNYVNFAVYKPDGIFIQNTFRSYYMNQLMGFWNRNMDEAAMLLYTERMKAVSTVITQEEFQEAQNFFAQNALPFWNGELKQGDIRDFINKHNVKEEINEDAVNSMQVDDLGRYKIDF